MERGVEGESKVLVAFDAVEEEHPSKYGEYLLKGHTNVFTSKSILTFEESVLRLSDNASGNTRRSSGEQYQFVGD